MTDITYETRTSGTATRGHGTGLLASFTAYCGQFVEGAREGQQIATRYHALSRLSGVDLASRGLTRHTIARAALTGD